MAKNRGLFAAVSSFWRIPILAAMVLATGAFGYYFYAFAPTKLIAVNYSPSLAYSVYLVDKMDTDITYGDLIAFKPPLEAAGGRNFIKRVKGLPGDLIRREGDIYYIGDAEVGYIQAYTRIGQPLEGIKTGIIPKGKIFVVGDHFGSFDSRYKIIGLIDMEAVSGTAKPLF
ncbi:MAG: signal peptidase I [Robiginitomaculum sp.]|nr:MAG: signal peptidase I [Robiginitomaculum sp.]